MVSAHVWAQVRLTASVGGPLTQHKWNNAIFYTLWSVPLTVLVCGRVGVTPGTGHQLWEGVGHIAYIICVCVCALGGVGSRTGVQGQQFQDTLGAEARSDRHPLEPCEGAKGSGWSGRRWGGGA